MDIFAHSLWASAGALKINDNLEEKKKRKISIIWSALWGVFPDFFAFGIPSLLSFYAIIFGSATFESLSHHGPHLTNSDNTFNLASNLYQYSHSLIIFLIIFGIVWYLRKKPWLAMFGWGLHILLDIPSHSLKFFPTPFLFPFSEYRFPYGVQWADKWFMIFNYSALLIIFLYFLFRKKVNKNG